MSRENKPYAGGPIPENYERHLVPLLFLDYAAELVADLNIPPGAAILETACGTGAVTRHLQPILEQIGRLTVTDLAPAMVEIVQQVVGEHPSVEYQQADATELHFADGLFDVVICQFSMMLLPDREKGIREAARVLKPGGRFVFNVWDKLERNSFSRAVHEAVAEIFPDDPPRFLEAPYSYHDLSEIVGSLQKNGFGDVDIAVQPRNSNASDAHQVAAGLVAGSPLAIEVAERGSPSVEEVTVAVEDAIAREFGPGPITAPMQAFHISAEVANGHREAA